MSVRTPLPEQALSRQQQTAFRDALPILRGKQRRPA